MQQNNQSLDYAVVFPGQGSQSVGMLNGWIKHQDVAGQLITEANETLGYDIAAVIKAGPKEKLGQTAITQPAMLVAGTIAWTIWTKHCAENNLPLPKILAGHSLGEYTALVAAEVLSFADALLLVEYRGHCMQEAVAEGEGAMAAILGLEDSKVIECCELASAEGVVEAVNFNAPGQVVIAGEKKAVEVAQELLKEAGARRALSLPVSVPSHCQLMIPAAKRLEARIQTLKLNSPKIPVLHNVDVKSHNTETAIAQVLEQQLHKPVRWVETMQAIAETGIQTIIECGPGKVLCGLQKRIDKSVTAHPLFDDESFERVATEFFSSD